MIFQLDFQSTSPSTASCGIRWCLPSLRAADPGERLPTTRALAEDAGVNVMTVSKAYQLLKSEGILSPTGAAAPWYAPRRTRG